MTLTLVISPEQSLALEDLLHVATVVGDAPLGPRPHVQDGPVDHVWIKQSDLVANVLLQLIQGSRSGVVDLAFEVSPEEKIQWRKVGTPRWPLTPPPALPADDTPLELSVKVGHVCICTVRGRSILLPPQAEK